MKLKPLLATLFLDSIDLPPTTTLIFCVAGSIAISNCFTLGTSLGPLYTRTLSLPSFCLNEAFLGLHQKVARKFMLTSGFQSEGFQLAAGNFLTSAALSSWHSVSPPSTMKASLRPLVKDATALSTAGLSGLPLLQSIQQLHCDQLPFGNHGKQSSSQCFSLAASAKMMPTLSVMPCVLHAAVSLMHTLHIFVLSAALLDVDEEPASIRLFSGLESLCHSLRKSSCWSTRRREGSSPLYLSMSSSAAPSPVVGFLAPTCRRMAPSEAILSKSFLRMAAVWGSICFRVSSSSFMVQSTLRKGSLSPSLMASEMAPSTAFICLRSCTMRLFQSSLYNGFLKAELPVPMTHHVVEGEMLRQSSQ
mmetsp:Transcript_23242/g.45102  ORF Transcript_23242/g.45102 Transcript_23242/m.45102 type:complete len:361 (-) Transcript_23242:1718-2800(-)